MNISIAHSPDSDDYFLFWALREGRLPHPGFTFTFTSFPTDQLNARAAKSLDDVTAVSLGAYPKLADKYRILSSGASVGRSYGPVLVATTERSLESLANARIAIPGEDTTAAAVLRMILPGAATQVLSIEPYTRVLDALKQGQFEAAVLIHEAQLLWKQHGLFRIADCGQWWEQETGLPLVLGINVIRKSLGQSVIQDLSRLFEASVRYAIEHQAEAIDYLVDINRQRALELTDREHIETYLKKYANSDSVVLPMDCRDSVVAFLQRCNCRCESSDLWADPQ